MMIKRTFLAALAVSFPMLAASLVPTGSPVKVAPDGYAVQSNATVTAAGNKIVCTPSWNQVSLVVNAKGTFTGSPTLTYTLAEVDPGDQASTFAGALTTTGAAISAAGTQVLTITGTTSPCVKVSWAFTGTSITQVYSTLTTRVSVTDTASDSTASGTISAVCTDANINACGANSTAEILTAGQLGVSALVPTSSTLVTALKPDCGFTSADGTVTWWESTWFDDPSGVKVASYTTVSGTGNALSIIGCHGASKVRVRASTAPTGSGLISLRASFLSDPSSTYSGPIEGDYDATKPPVALYTRNLTGGKNSFTVNSGPITGATATGTKHLAYIWHPAAVTKMYHLIGCSVSQIAGSGGTQRLEVQRISAENATPGGTTGTILQFDTTGTASGATFRIAPTGAPTTVSGVAFGTDLPVGLNGTAVVPPPAISSPMIAMEAEPFMFGVGSAASGLSIEQVVATTITAAPVFNVTCSWTEQ